MAFLQGNWLPRSTSGGIANAIRNWRITLGLPLCYHEDEIPIKTLETAPTPNYNGSYIFGANEPDPIHGQYDEFSAFVYADPVTIVTQSPPEHRGLTVIGPTYPTEIFLDCELDGALDDFAPYLLFGVLARIFGSDSELADQQRAAYCAAQFSEGVNLAREITGEPDEAATG